MNKNRFWFRGLQIDDNRWVQGYYAHVQGKSQIIKPSSEICFVDPKTVGQCTSKKDKNGVLIFEGDCIDKKYNAIVIFWRAGFWVDHIHGNIRKKTSLSDWLFGRDQALVGSEIISNIHQHPELLEGGS